MFCPSVCLSVCISASTPGHTRPEAKQGQQGGPGQRTKICQGRPKGGHGWARGGPGDARRGQESQEGKGEARG